jgi:hypothetical protein
VKYLKEPRNIGENEKCFNKCVVIVKQIRFSEFKRKNVFEYK